MKHPSKIKNFFLPLIIAVIVVSPIHTQKASAIGIFVPTNDAMLNVATSLHASFQDVAKMGLDTLAYTAAQMALDQITQNTVSWIQGGFNGSPSFAVDPAKLFLNTADAVSGGLASQIRNLSTTCKVGNVNFNVNSLANMVDLSTRSGATNKFAAQLRCPFPATIDPTKFYSDGSGGWEGFGSALQDAGNGFGSRILVSQELKTLQAEATHIQEQKLNWGNGFLDQVDTSNCDYPPEVNKAMTSTLTASDTGLSSPDALPPEAVKAYQQSYCKTATPGKTIADTLAQATGMDTQRLNMADNMNKIIAAFVGQITKSVTVGVFK